MTDKFNIPPTNNASQDSAKHENGQSKSNNKNNHNNHAVSH